MTYQIHRIAPTYCAITDGLIGSKAHPLPMSYRTLALAHKLAGKLEEDSYNNCGDDRYVVTYYGESAFSAPLFPAYRAPEVPDDYMPF